MLSAIQANSCKPGFLKKREKNLKNKKTYKKKRLKKSDWKKKCDLKKQKKQ